VGKIIYDLEGIERISFPLGLGRSTNNQIEEMALYMGLRLINFDHFKDVTVIEDSKLIIKGARKKSGHSDHNLVRAIQRISEEEK